MTRAFVNFMINLMRQTFSKNAFFSFVFLLLLVPVTVYALTRYTGSFETRSQAAPAGAKIYVWPTSTTLTQNQYLDVSVRLSANQNLSNVDLVLSFNPQVAEVVGNVVPGTMFNQYVARLVDNQKGLVGIGGRGTTNGEGVFASFKLHTKVKGDVNLRFNYLNAGGATLDAQTADYQVQ